MKFGNKIHKIDIYLVKISMGKCNMVIACYAISKGR